MNGSFSKLKKLKDEAQSVLREKHLGHEEHKLTSFQKFVHFCALTWRAFVGNRCLARASALAYTTLLALVPLMAVAISVATSFLKGETGQQQVREMVDRAITQLAPQVGLVAKSGGGINPQKQITDFIFGAIGNVSVGTLGASAIIALLFIAISLLANIESALNDIWGVRQGRSWFNRVVLYWAAISLGPLLLITALGFNLSSNFELVRNFAGPWMVRVLSQVVPVILVVITFALFYLLMPNTRVEWRAALIGGLAGGILFHLNNSFSTVYLGQVVRNSRIYGSLAVIPILLAGLYFSWVILLFGAQISYAIQSRRAYLQEKLLKNLNQRDREFIALRVMNFLADRFAKGARPPSLREVSEEIGVPIRLAQMTLDPLQQGGLVIEATGPEPGYAPARPPGKITYGDILETMRGRKLQVTAREDEAQKRVLSELEKIEQAEGAAAESITLEASQNKPENYLPHT